MRAAIRMPAIDYGRDKCAAGQNVRLALIRIGSDVFHHMNLNDDVWLALDWRLLR